MFSPEFVDVAKAALKAAAKSAVFSAILTAFLLLGSEVAISNGAPVMAAQLICGAIFGMFFVWMVGNEVTKR